MQVFVEPDASVRIVYDITFHNNPIGHAIDIVDIGVPHRGYDLQQVRASIGDAPLGDIRPSTVVQPGFEVHLEQRHDRARRAGHVARRVPDA